MFDEVASSHMVRTPSKSFGAKQPSLLSRINPLWPCVAKRAKPALVFCVVFSSSRQRPSKDRLAGMIDDDDLFVRSLATTHRASRVSAFLVFTGIRFRDTALQ